MPPHLSLRPVESNKTPLPTNECLTMFHLAAWLLLIIFSVTHIFVGAANGVCTSDQVGDCVGVDYDAVRLAVKEQIFDVDPNRGPTLVRLAWHSSATYDKMTGTGGSQLGTIHFKEELSHAGNGGMDLAVEWLEPIYKRFSSDGLSYADLYTLVGVESIKLMGGPVISWRAGRVDTVDPVTDTPPNGRLPQADKGSTSETVQHLRDVFSRMGFDDRELVALSGAHALGRCHTSASGYEGAWTHSPTIFNNEYFRLLLDIDWRPNPAASKLQYTDPTGSLLMLPSDLALIQDPSLKPIVEEYANDQAKFFADFSTSFGKLLELGTKDLITI